MKLSQFVFVSMLLSVNLTAVGCAQQESKSPEHQTPHVQTAQKSTGTTDSPLPNEKSTAESTLDSKSDSTPSTDSIALFDGKSLDGWEITNFGGERDCRAENGSLFIDAGDPLNGITSTRQDLPKTDFEISCDLPIKRQGQYGRKAQPGAVGSMPLRLSEGGWAPEPERAQRLLKLAL